MTDGEKGTTAGFNLTADALPKSAFADSLDEYFGEKTARAVFKIFDKLGLPAPEAKDEFIKGNKGCLVFLDRYGLVMRIEFAYEPVPGFEKVKHPVRILPSLGSVPACRAMVDFYPGCPQEEKKANSVELQKLLKEEGLNYWDEKLSSVGRMPIQTPMFPEGVTVVIDVDAVNRRAPPKEDASEPDEFSFIGKDPYDFSLMRVNPARKIFNALGLSRSQKGMREAAAARNKLYGPLEQAFAAAWPDKSSSPDVEKFQQFLSLCKQSVAEGKLVAGWSKPQVEEATVEKCQSGDNKRTLRAAVAGKNYEARLNSVNSAAGAVPQSPHPPA